MYRVTVNGITIECETAPREKLARHNGTTTTGTRWTDRRVRDLLKHLSTGQRKLLDALLATPDGRTDLQLRQSLGLDNNSALGGVFTGFIRNVKKVGGDPNDLYSTEKVTIGGQPVNEFKLSASFRSVAEQVLGEQ